MTDRLTQMLREEAANLGVPAAPTDVVLSAGRRQRRRRRAAVTAAGVAAAVVVGASVLAVTQGFGGGREEQSFVSDPDGDAGAAGATFSIGPRVYTGSGNRSGTVDDVTVKSLYYTSAGVLVRHGLNDYSDGGGAQRFSLVRPDGAVQPLSLETEETYHATDPDQPYVAYAQLIDGVNHVLVRDVTTDEEVADVMVPGDTNTFSPVSLDGDLVYVGDGDQVHVVDWRTGEVSDSPVLEGNPEVAGGRALEYYGADPGVIDAVSGDMVLDLSGSEDTFASFSPDGAFVVVQQYFGVAQPLQVYDVATGASTEIRLSDSWGWTAEGELFELTDSGTLKTCAPTSGECESEQLDLPVLPNSIPDEGIACSIAPDGTTETCEEPDASTFADSLALGGRIAES